MFVFCDIAVSNTWMSEPSLAMTMTEFVYIITPLSSLLSIHVLKQCRERGVSARYMNQTTQHVVQRKALVTPYYNSCKFD